MLSIPIGILLVIVLFYAKKKWQIRKRSQSLSKDLLWDNQESKNIGRKFLIDKSFESEIVGQRTVWFRIEDNKLQIVKVKKRKLRIGYGADWQSEKRYQEILVDLGSLKEEYEEEIVGVEKSFIFREYSEWELEKMDLILESSYKTLSYFVEHDQKINLLKSFSEYKLRVDNLIDEPLI
jgi:hypothetical protein